jgi:predicted TIM-barrel fold metal-dependent hydrolase
MTCADRALPPAIVDAHHHLWRLDQGRYPWLQDAYDPGSFILGEYAAICRDFEPDAYRAACEGLPVRATVHVEAERDRQEALAETRWLWQQHRHHGLPDAIVAWVDLLADDADDRLAEQAACPLVRGIRFKPVTAHQAGRSVVDVPGSLQDPRWPAALRRLASHDLLWDLRVPSWHLVEAAELIEQVPDLTVVLEHAGLPWDRSEAGLAEWRQGMQALAALDRVHVKLSEFGLRDRPWRREDNDRIVRETVEVFGAQRCLFGSNFPVASLRIGYPDLVRSIDAALSHLGADERQAIWHDNAVRLYRLASPLLTEEPQP